MGTAYGSLGQYQRAIEFYQQSLEIARDIGDRNSEGKSLMTLSVAYRLCGRMQEEFEAFNQAQQIFRELGLPFEDSR